MYNNQKWTPVDLQKKNDDELVQLQLHPNDWFVRHARRILQERGPNPAVHKALAEVLTHDASPAHQLRALWALHATAGLTETTALGAAYLAGLGVGVFGGLSDIAGGWALERRFEPEMSSGVRDALYEGWEKAVSRVR